ncbi:hypothetical protein AHP1_381 [Aeromonas phage Ahp1_CNU-2021]|nr:hypothetical protein AHP1_381 [Aeromonas phage Ahp1_CNU-2021]
MFYHKRDFTPHTNNTVFCMLKDMKSGHVFPMLGDTWILQSIDQPTKNKSSGDSAPRYKFRNADLTKSSVLHISHGEVHVAVFEWHSMETETHVLALADLGLKKCGSYYGRDFVMSTTKGVITGTPYEVDDRFEIRAAGKPTRNGVVRMVTDRFMLVTDEAGDPLVFRKSDFSTMNRQGIAFLDESKYDHQFTTPGYLAID